MEKVFRQYCSIVGKIAGGWNIFKARSKNEVRGVRSFLNFLVEQGILDETTANDIKKRIKFKENEHVDTTVFTVQEVIELLSRTQTSDPRLHYLIRLGLESGLRRSELVLAVQKLRSEGFQSEGKVAWVSLNKNTKTKRAFVCFLSIEVAKYFANRKVKVSLDILNNYSKRENIKWHKLRKTQATFLYRLGVQDSVVDYIQGRVPRSVLARHYLSLFTLSLEAMRQYIDWLEREVYFKLIVGK